jgi:hypothetical protein
MGTPIDRDEYGISVSFGTKYVHPIIKTYICSINQSV